MEKVEKKKPRFGLKNTVIEDPVLSVFEVKLLNLIAEIIVNISIRERYEESHQISAFQRQKAK
ncbi:hypothetical protein [Emticicia sp. TH156]|uniref:hypothetical protein n=1 Tax=Emticicia sp. TH156 TaxID=2067454 RepID=UPI000C793B8A|nr:hypothetical protein [Emticicia sp. TH156]PLK44999.1 hypothetical protein C0V77_07075 [Emticicia sp. TH156]